MMKQLAAMQERMVAEQEALRKETVEISVGGGAVKVQMNGHQKLVSVVIDPELLKAEEAEMLADLLIASVNQAVDKTQTMAQDRMGSITQGLGLPPGLGL
jgi:DNA-binding YbaB/EbfC family protein